MKETDKTDKEYFSYDEPYTFTDNGGKEVEFNFIEEVYIDGVHYAFFAPIEKLDGLDTDEVVGFIVEDTDVEEFTLKPVTDEVELDKAFTEFIKKINEMAEAEEDDDDECDCDDEECDCDCCGDDCDDEDCDCDCHDDKEECDCGCGKKKNK